MSRETENALLLLIGVSTALIVVTGSFTRYVKPTLLPYLIAEDSLALNLARGFVDSTFNQDDLPAAARAPFAEYLSRAIHSLILIPGGVLNIDSPSGPEDYARTFLLPVLRSMSAEAAVIQP